MGRDKDKDKDKDHKERKKDKEKKDKKKEKSHREKSSHSSRHKHDRTSRRHSSSEEEKHRSHHRSPSSKDRRDKDRRREELKRKRSDSPHPDEKEDVVDSKRAHTEKEEVTGSAQVSGGGALELSIEETNKLRLELGLKPLDLGGTATTEQNEAENKEEEEEGSKEEAPKKKEDVHVPAKNIGELKKAEKIREKIEMMRESRKLASKLGSVHGLSEADSNTADDTASDWVKKMREKEKRLAKERARLLEEMDDGYGGSDENPVIHEYSAKDLAGMTIEHKEDRFKEGRDVVLTLKDAKILDDEEDVLVNVNMIDEEKGHRNIELKKNLPGYQPYEEEFDEYGNPITRSLLYKYDEEIEGQKVNKFVLGDSGDYDVSELQREKEKAREVLQQKAIALELPELSLASEYYTSEEMVQFRKRKKRKKKEKFKVDDLVSLGTEGQDHGSRQKEPAEQSLEVDMDTDIKTDPSLLDEADSKVDSALERTRRLLSRKKASSDSTGAAHVAAILSSVTPKVSIKKEKTDDSEGLVADDGLIVIDTTAEFCRQIGEEESAAVDTSKWKHLGTIKDEAMEEGLKESEQDDDGGWMEIDPDSKQTDDVPEKPDVLELEAKTHMTGVAAALSMASKKGFFEVEKEKTVKRKGDSKTIIEGLGMRDWEYERDRGRERDKDKDSHGREISFCEKKDYIPEVHIEYVDDRGRLLTAKEAFRHMSHKFHGKGPGKKKTEKLIKRRKEDVLLSKADAGDTPLQSLELLRKKQEFSQSPFVVLTGQHQQTIHTTELAKRK